MADDRFQTASSRSSELGSHQHVMIFRQIAPASRAALQRTSQTGLTPWGVPLAQRRVLMPFRSK